MFSPKAARNFFIILGFLSLAIFPKAVFSVYIWDAGGGFREADNPPSPHEDCVWCYSFDGPRYCTGSFDWVFPDLRACPGSYQNTCCTSPGGCTAADGTALRQWDWNYAVGCRAVMDQWCTFKYVYTTRTCGATDSCFGSPYLYAGLCSDIGCDVGGRYKVCCNADGTVDGNCNGGRFTGTCPAGTITKFCGWGGYPACDAPNVCGGAAPPPTAGPTPPIGTGGCDLGCGVCGYRQSNNECTTDYNCCHRECSGETCIPVFGTGANQCDSDVDCNPTPSYCPLGSLESCDSWINIDVPNRAVAGEIVALRAFQHPGWGALPRSSCLYEFIGYNVSGPAGDFTLTAGNFLIGHENPPPSITTSEPVEHIWLNNRVTEGAIMWDTTGLPAGTYTFSGGSYGGHTDNCHEGWSSECCDQIRADLDPRYTGVSYMKAILGRDPNHIITLSSKTCSLALTNNSAVQGEADSIRIGYDGIAEPGQYVRLWVESKTGSPVGDLPKDKEYTGGGVTSYLVSECQAGGDGSCSGSYTLPANLAADDYYLHCDVPDDPGKCSGSPICPYESDFCSRCPGPICSKGACDGWLSCSPSDNACFTITSPCVSTAPAAPSLSSPADDYHTSDTSLTLDWDSISSWGLNCSGNNNQYKVYLKKGSSDFIESDVVATVGSGTTQQVVAVEAGNTYYWKVVATNGALSASSETWNFCIDKAPNAPTLSSPADDVNLGTLPASISWSAPASWGVCCSTQSNHYLVYLDDNSDFSSPIINGESTTATSRSLSGLVEAGKRYYWKIAAHNGCLSTTSSVWSFCINKAPDAASGLSDGTFQDNWDIPLSWKNVSNWGLNCTGNTISYAVYYCKKGDPNCCKAGDPGCLFDNVPDANRCSPVEDVPFTPYSSCTIPGPLSWESTYYWKVVTSNGALNNEAFSSFEITHPSAWWQTKTGDVYGNEIFSPIWREATSPYFSLIGPFGLQSGLVAAPNCSGAGCDFGEGTATETQGNAWSIDGSAQALLNDYSYDKLAHLVDLAIKENKQESYNPLVRVITGVLNGSSIEKEELTDNPSPLFLYYYPPLDAGAVSLDDDFSVGVNEKFIVFIEDDLHINANVTVNAANGGFLAFIVSGDVEIAADVTQVQGVYFADGNLTVESMGNTSEQRFDGQGIFVGKNGVSLGRSFRDERNATQPTEVFTFDPSYLFTAPKVFREKPYLWQEVIP